MVNPDTVRIVVLLCGVIDMQAKRYHAKLRCAYCGTVPTGHAEIYCMEMYAANGEQFNRKFCSRACAEDARHEASNAWGALSHAQVCADITSLEVDIV